MFSPCPRMPFAALTALIVWSLCWSCCTSCIHDSLKLASLTTSTQLYVPIHGNTDLQDVQNDTDTTDHRRLVDSTSYQPIRITPYYDDASLSKLPEANEEVVRKIVPDAIRYFQNLLRVVPVQTNLFATRTCETSWVTKPPVCVSFVKDEECLEMVIPPSHFETTRTCKTCFSDGCTNGDCTTLKGQGVANTDFVLYVKAVTTSYCTDSVVAYAASCQKDQFDRPTFGMVNFCPSQIDTSVKEYEYQLTTALHELTHALGFSAQFFSLMRDENLAPRTPRDPATGDPKVVFDVTCSNGHSAPAYAQPAASTVQFFNERGGVVGKLVTPKVLAMAKKHFGCDSLNGAELENQDDGCLGSHWEERIFEPEIMSPVMSFRNVFSNLTLAFFEDSGWYKVNWDMARNLRFGEQKGCDFAMKTCISTSTHVSSAPAEFCTNADVESCSADGFSRSVCGLSTGKSIPKAYQYFTDPTLGGDNSYADFCPINMGYSLGDCADPDNMITSNNKTLNILGETYCSTCKCTPTTLRNDNLNNWVVSTRRQTGCYSMTCMADGSIEITIPVQASSAASGALTSKTVLCEAGAKGQTKTVVGFHGAITCPDPVIVCENDCPNACFGNGECNLKTSTCTCADGWTGEDCSISTGAPKPTTKVQLRTDSFAMRRQPTTLLSMMWLVVLIYPAL